MTRAGFNHLGIKRARDSLLVQGRHPSIDAIRITLGNMGSKMTIHRYLKELEEEEGAALERAGTTSDAVLDLVGRLAVHLHEEGQAVVGQQVAAATAQRQQVRAEADKLFADLTMLRAELAQTHATIANVRAAQSDTQTALQQRTVEAERSAQQLQDLTARLAGYEGFRRSLEDKLQYAHQALKHSHNASKEQRDQNVRQHGQQVRQLQAETRQADQTLIVRQGKITQLNKDSVRLATEAGTVAKRVCELEMRGEQTQLALDRAHADRARVEAERGALRATVQAQVGELATARMKRENTVGELAKLSAFLEAQQVMLTNYRTRFGVADPAA